MPKRKTKGPYLEQLMDNESVQTLLTAQAHINIAISLVRAFDKRRYNAGGLTRLPVNDLDQKLISSSSAIYHLLFSEEIRRSLDRGKNGFTFDNQMLEFPGRKDRS